MQFHKLDRARDQNFWSVRVSRDIRLIVHKTKASLLLCYVAHHNAAYQWAERIGEGIAPEAIGVFFRSKTELSRARSAIEAAGLSATELEDALAPTPGKVALMTMHLAKGLEYRAVLVMACDDEVIPLQERVASVTDDSDLEEVYNTERHLLYVACTRARDHLMVTGVDPASEFLDDLLG